MREIRLWLYSRQETLYYHERLGSLDITCHVLQKILILDILIEKFITSFICLDEYSLPMYA